MNIRDIKKFNEEIKELLKLNELSDETRQSYLAKRKSQLDTAQTKFNKAKDFIKKADIRQINNASKQAKIDDAFEILEDLKSEMQRFSDGRNWKLKQNDNKVTLEVRYWGDWINPEDAETEEDYDWQVLSPSWKEKLDNILFTIQKKHHVQITRNNSEKNWLEFDINVEADVIIQKMFDYMLDEEWLSKTVESQGLTLILGEENIIFDYDDGIFPNAYAGLFVKYLDYYIQITVHSTKHSMSYCISDSLENASMGEGLWYENSNVNFRYIFDIKTWLPKVCKQIKEKIDNMKKK